MKTERARNRTQKENDYDLNHFHGSSTVFSSKIDRISFSKSQIQQTSPLSSRDNLMMNDGIETTVPKYVNSHPLFTKKYFQFVNSMANNVVIATCCSCNENKQGLSTTISNFTTHLKRKHPEAYAQLEDSKVPINNEETKKSLKRSSINNKGANVLKENVEKAIIRFIIQDMQPFIRTETAAL